MTEPAPRAGAEAARLLAAAQDWLRTSAPHLAPLDSDGEPCSCPLCRAVASVREADPATVGRWVDGAVAAFESVVAQATAPRADATGDDVDDMDDMDAEDAQVADEPEASEPVADDAPGGPRRVRRIALDPEPGAEW